MPNRCESCNKFTALEFQEPEEESFEVDGLETITEDGTVAATASATIHISRNSECCGDTMKEATLEMSEEFVIDHDKLEEHLVEKEGGGWTWKKGCELSAACDDWEQVEEGGGRYAKSYFGASTTYRVTCKCGKGDELHEGALEDKIAASEMDDAC